MATIDLGSKHITDVDLLNSIRNSASAVYQKRVPVASQNTVRDTLVALSSNAQTFSEFYSAITTLGVLNVSGANWTDPLGEIFKKGNLSFGDSVEDIFISFAEGQMYNADDGEDVFSIVKPDMRALYGTVNRRDKYKVTTSFAEARRILLSNGLDGLLNSITQSLRAGAERDATRYVKQSLVESVKQGNVIFVKVPDPRVTGGQNAALFLSKLREYYLNAQWADPETPLNASGADNPTKAENLVTIIPNSIESVLDVTQLAHAFNLEYADYLGRKVPINTLGDDNILGMILDKEFLQIYDYLDYATSIDNPSNLTTNNFLHVWQSYMTVSTRNAIVFVKDLPENFEEYLKLVPAKLSNYVVNVSKANEVTFKPLYPVELEKAKDNAKIPGVVTLQVLDETNKVDASAQVTFDTADLGEGVQVSTQDGVTTLTGWDFVTPLKVKIPQMNKDYAFKEVLQLTVQVGNKNVTGDALEDENSFKKVSNIQLVNGRIS